MTTALLLALVPQRRQDGKETKKKHPDLFVTAPQFHTPVMLTLDFYNIDILVAGNHEVKMANANDIPNLYKGFVRKNQTKKQYYQQVVSLAGATFMPMGTSSLEHFAPDAFPILTAMANQLSSLDGIYPDLAFSKVKAFLQVEVQKSIAIIALNCLERTSAVPAIRLEGSKE